MLSSYQLSLLPLNEQVQYVWDHGKFVGNSIHKGFPTNLYWMGNYYAEVVYNDVENRIEDIICREAFGSN
jgi:hypothetical protein